MWTARYSVVMHTRIIKKVKRERINEGKNLAVHEPSDKKPSESQSRESARHESSRGVFAHQHRDSVMSIKGREGKQIEGAKQKIQHKQNAERCGGQLCSAARGVRGLSDSRV